MGVTWIVIANSSEVFIYSLDPKAMSKGKVKINLISNYNHPESRQKDGDLISDRSGHFYTNSATLGPGSFDTPTDPKKHEADIFAKQIAEKLEAAHLANRFERLIVFSAPQFHGLLNKHLNKKVNNLIAMFIDKDYTKLPSKRLEEHLEQHLIEKQ